jgi:hypothetical protein
MTMSTLPQQWVQNARAWARVVLVLAVAAFARTAHAQPAPPVPASYESLSVGVITASYPPNAKARVDELLRDVPRVTQVLGKMLSHPLDQAIDLRFAWSPDDMAALAPVDAPPPRYATGVSYPAQRVAIVALADLRSTNDANASETLAHELAHVALAEATDDAPLPRWFHEGFAIHAAGERSIARYQVLAEAAAFRRLIALDVLDQHFGDESFDVTLAYAESADILRFLSRDGDRQRFVSLLERVRVGVPFDRALGDAYGLDLRKLDYEWRGDAAKRFAFLPIFTGGSVVWVALAVVFAFGWARKRREAKATLARWDAEETHAHRLAELRRLGETEEPVGVEAIVASPFPPGVSAPKIVVEHEGRWHTLH